MSNYVIYKGGLYSADELYHHGVKGMKWGVRKKYPDRLDYPKNSSSVTRKAIDDYNRMSDREFKAKAHVSKKTYAKRVAKYGDPYMNAPLAKIGKRLEGKKVSKKQAIANVKKKITKEKAAKAVAKGVTVTSGLIMAGMYDQFLFGGAGRKAVGTAVKQTGRAVVSAWVYAHGGRDIHWYDN